MCCYREINVCDLHRCQCAIFDITLGIDFPLLFNGSLQSNIFDSVLWLAWQYAG